MKRKALALCEDDEFYSYKMVQFLKARIPIPMEIMLFSSVEKLRKYALHHDIEILLLAEHMYQKGELRGRFNHIIFLKEEGDSIPEGKLKVQKFQPIDSLLKEVMSIYGNIASNEVGQNGRNGEIISVYSPIARSGQTTFSLLLGQLLAKKKRVLYLNLEAVSGMASLLQKKYEHDICDLLYYLNREEEKLAYRIGNCVETIGKLEYIPPANSFFDLCSISGEEWCRLIQVIRQYTAYEYIILDLSECVMGLFDLLKESKRVYSMIREDSVSCAKLRQYEELLLEKEYEDVWKKTQQFHLPVFSNWNVSIEELPVSQLAEYVKKIVKEDFDG